jgi:predicted helicase
MPSKSKSEAIPRDIYGKQEDKHNSLDSNAAALIHGNQSEPDECDSLFIPKGFEGEEAYENGFKMEALFQVNGNGITTEKDGVLIKDTKQELYESIKSCYKMPPDHTRIKKIAYRPFDFRYIFYDIDLVDGTREKAVRQLLRYNMALVMPRQSIDSLGHLFIANTICDRNLIDTEGQVEAGYVFPLYLNPEANNADLFAETVRQPNLNPEIVQRIASGLGLLFTPEKEDGEGNVCFAHNTGVSAAYRLTFAPIDVLDYIYAVLHSPTYRETYKEFLKIDFPRVPYPTDSGRFWHLVELGGQLRQLHLLRSIGIETYITDYPIDGTNQVEKIRYEDGKVWINAEQYFDGVPELAWQFYIGGYQPAQKWLKDRKDRILSMDDVLHYQKIIVALTETARLMNEVDRMWNVE